uniref:Membrane spanning 4-domains A2 n=1 Tax=Pipistrellus kuhlii TaxID=59472 RepID=A0A7J7X0J8_PIPKU|nr:membrane spanning 4-domains A2 [Pipistrellus kuhlii]
MDSENRSRADLALPNPQDSSSVPEIELSEAPFRDSTLPEKAAPPPRQTWLTFLKRELEFLGVTQILIGFICLYFGTIVYFVFKISEFEKEFFSSFKIGYPLWGAVIFAISGFLSIMSEKKNAAYLQAYEDDFCIAAFFSTELVAMILFLTILGFGAAVLLIAYRIGELLKENQIPEDRLYEELNIYSPIYSELEDRVETSPTDT